MIMCERNNTYRGLVLSSRLQKSVFAERFRNLYPVVVDVETSGLNSETDAILELAAVTLKISDEGIIYPDKTIAYHIEPFIGANIDKESLEITGIDPLYPLRYATPEQYALFDFFSQIKKLVELNGCQRAVLVGHNAWFDLMFMQAAARRAKLLNNPFHSFTTFDTATLSVIAFNETVLARAARRAKISFDVKYAHSAIYDAEKTAELFCCIVNRISQRS